MCAVVVFGDATHSSLRDLLDAGLITAAHLPETDHELIAAIDGTDIGPLDVCFCCIDLASVLARAGLEAVPDLSGDYVVLGRR